MSQERRVYSKFRSPDLADIANMRPGVSKDCIIEAWVATRLSIHQASFRPSNQLLYFCATAEGGTSDIEAKTLVPPSRQGGWNRCVSIREAPFLSVSRFGWSQTNSLWCMPH